MKHVHMLMAALTLLLFVYQAAMVFSGKSVKLSAAFKGVSHLIYTVLMLTGLWLFWQLYQVAGVQHWAIAKLVLLIVAVSANIKALRNQDVAPSQAKAGMMIAAVAYAGIIYMAIAKPILM